MHSPINDYVCMKPIILLILLFLISFPLQAQQGIPYVYNYSKNDFNAAGRNWAIATDSQGNIYAGNSNGLLRFNGSEWQLYSLPGNRIVRSVFCDKDERIYVGSFEEFGFFENNHVGELIYTSLSDSADYVFHNDEIWNIVSYQEKIYFRSFTAYFTFDGKSVKTVSLPFTLVYLASVDDVLYGYLLDQGLCRFDDGDFTLIYPKEQFGNSNIVAFLPFTDEKKLLFSTVNGIFIAEDEKCSLWDNEVNEKLKLAVINRVEMTKDSTYIIGTILDGIYALNKQGHLLWRINTESGLANNTVLALDCDNDNNIWVALDNGISYIRSNSNLRFINSFKQNIGYVYSALVKDGYLYLATNQGLFCSDEKNPLENMQLINKTEGQAWDLSLIDGQLFCGHNEGTFEISGQHATQISSIKGGTTICKGEIHGQEVLVQSTYTYLVIYKRNHANRWVFSHAVQGFMHPVRFIEIDGQGNIWAQHFYKGLYRIKLNPDLLSVAQMTLINLPGSVAKEQSVINLFKIRGRVAFSNNNGFFTYDDLTDSIKPFVYLNDQLAGIKGIRKSIAVNDDQYWLVCPDRFLLVDFNKRGAKVMQEVPFSLLYNDLPDKDENIVVLPDNKYLFCLNNGVAILDNHWETFFPKWERKLRIERIESRHNDNLLLLPLHPNQMPQIRYAYNTLVFHVAFPHSSGDNIKYSYHLEGVDNDWTMPSLQPSKEYARLYPGLFKLHIRATDNLGNVLDTIQYQFEISAPFYASKIAFIVYILTALGSIILTIWLIERRMTKNKQKILQEQQELRRKESEQQEHKIIQLKNEKLETELTYKSKELASSTMSIIRKNEILVEIKEELTEQKMKLGTQYPNKYYEKLVHMIDSNLSSEDDWKIFQTNFDRIHENFFRNLKITYPDLTSTDLKFCAFLRLNLSTKEIAHLMNITIKGVEVGRYRLRKKLGLASEVNLVDFMINFK